MASPCLCDGQPLGRSHDAGMIDIICSFVSESGSQGRVARLEDDSEVFDYVDLFVGCRDDGNARKTFVCGLYLFVCMF